MSMSTRPPRELTPHQWIERNVMQWGLGPRETREHVHVLIDHFFGQGQAYFDPDKRPHEELPLLIYTPYPIQMLNRVMTPVIQEYYETRIRDAVRVDDWLKEKVRQASGGEANFKEHREALHNFLFSNVGKRRDFPAYQQPRHNLGVLEREIGPLFKEYWENAVEKGRYWYPGGFGEWRQKPK